MIKVRSADIWRVRIPLRVEVKHALASRRESENVVVKLVLDDGSAGYGECVPREYVTGETADSAIAALTGVLLPTLRGHAFSDYGDVTVFLQDCEVSGAAKCAFELALIDAVTCRCEAGAHEIIGPPLRSSVHYTAVIPAVSAERFEQIATNVQLQQFRDVKIKVGAGDDDAERLKVFRRIAGEAPNVRVDANGAWDPDTALSHISRLQKYGISSVEQPIPARDIDGLAYVASRSPVPICVDESLVTVRDAQELISRQACHIFNLRLSKCGGLLNCLQLAELARQAGMRYQIGCQVGETGILSAAGRCLLMRLDDALHAEGSYSQWLLSKDITSPRVDFGFGGEAAKLSGPGFGTQVCQEDLAELTTSHSTLDLQ